MNLSIHSLDTSSQAPSFYKERFIEMINRILGV